MFGTSDDLVPDKKWVQIWQTASADLQNSQTDVQGTNANPLNSHCFQNSGGCWPCQKNYTGCNEHICDFGLLFLSACFVQTWSWP